MASVFLSYVRDDAAKAKSIATALERAGHSVWWDRHIKGGAVYSKEIETALKAAEAVMVLWSEQSVESAWVRDEAAAGRDSGRLIPVTLDRTEPPLGFRQYQAIDLSKWKGRGKGSVLDDLLQAVTGVASTRESDAPKRAAIGKPVPAFPPRAIMAGLAALAVFAAAYFSWKFYDGRSSVPLVAVTVASASGPARELANDLLGKLTELQSSEAEPIRLADDASSDQADLLFKVSGSLQGQPQASLILQGKDGMLLWSGGFQQPSGNIADLKQQLAFSAARILICATEGLSAEGKRLSQRTRRLYLNACAQSAEIMRSDPTAIVRTLSQVVEDEPSFKPAWGKLLMAESEITDHTFNAGETDPQLVAAHRGHIEQAKNAFPGLSETVLAEAMLLPPSDFRRRMRLVETAVAKDPDNPNVQAVLAGALASVGRSREAIEAARRAVELTPLSPAAVNGFISVLAYAGATDAAKRELQEAERLWPGTATVEDAQFRFHLRYGDPRIANAIFLRRADIGSTAWRLYLDARIDPSPANLAQLMTYVEERLRTMSNPSAGIGFATLAYGHFDRKEELFRTLLGWHKPLDLATLSEVLFRPEFREVRRDPRFMRVAHRAGLVGYWRASGEWPDYCFELKLPYDCKAEAAKLAA